MSPEMKIWVLQKEDQHPTVHRNDEREIMADESGRQREQKSTGESPRECFEDGVWRYFDLKR